jgi:hypothetical protein
MEVVLKTVEIARDVGDLALGRLLRLRSDRNE